LLLRVSYAEVREEAEGETERHAVHGVFRPP
jgi:hypothetical protein